jgi:formate dehydrogenase beta subunit/formate dehydrogenase gamma subunit
VSVRSDDQVAMLIDTTTCIGCKACEVACVEWNDLHIEPQVHRRPLDSYQTMPDMTPSYWNLIRFDEIDVGADRRPVRREAAGAGGNVMMLMRKDMCMHCAEPGCLISCPAEGAIVQLGNGIVDFNGDHCIGCGYCMTGCPFDTMCSDRVGAGLGPACVKACPTGCLEFGTKAEMVERATARAAQVVEEGFPQAGVYDPEGVGGTGVIYVLHHADQPSLYGGLPANPRIDPQIRFWKGPLRWFGGIAFGASLAAAAIHYLRSGPRRAPPAAPGTAEVVRYSLTERLLHWTVAASFVYLMLTGLGLFTRKLDWLLAVFGGGQVVRAWHPIVGCVFTGAVLLQFIKWFRDLLLDRADLRWLRRMRDYLAGRDDRVPPSGRFNAGQKLLFWVQTLLAIALLASGIPVWFPEAFGRDLRLWAIVIHSAAGVLAMLSLIVHVYMAVAVTRGGLRAMVEGKVSREWADHHHKTWADEQIGPEA